MAANIIFPKLNPIQLINVNTENWFIDEIPYFETIQGYCQKWQRTDIIKFQYAALDVDYVDADCWIVDKDDNILATVTVNTMIDTYRTGYHQYHVNIPLTSIADDTQCYVKLELSLTSARVYTYFSEPLHIKTLWSNTLKLEFTHDENDFNMLFFDTSLGEVGSSIIFQLRVEGGLKSDGYSPTSKDNIYRNDRADMTTVHSTPFVIKKFSFGDSTGIPNWLGDKINRVFSCYYSQINGVYYNKMENAKFEAIRSEMFPLAGWTLDLVEDEDMNGFDNFPFPMSRIYWLYRGIATAGDDPGTPIEDIFYMATYNEVAPQTYTNFGGLVVNAGEMAALRYDTVTATWAKDVFAEVTAASGIQVGTMDIVLRASMANIIDTTLSGVTAPVFMYQIYQMIDGILTTQPGIVMYQSGTDWYIYSEEDTTITIKIIGYEEPGS